jgi:preprotein translocase subunit YajC
MRPVLGGIARGQAFFYLDWTSLSMLPYPKTIFQGSVYMSFMPFLQASSTQGSILMPIVTFGLVFVIFYFFIIRPQNKKQKDTEKMISAVKKGDKVITIGGVHGEVTSTKEQTLIVKVDENCKIEFSRSAIASVVVDEKAAKSDKPAKAEKTSKKEKSEASTDEAQESK